MRYIIGIYTWVIFFGLVTGVICLTAQTPTPESPAVKKDEKYWQAIVAKELKGVTEFVLDDKARIDILTADTAIEVDWAKKWAEGIGQALYYSAKTTKKAGIVYIVQEDSDTVFVRRALVALNHHKLECAVYLIDTRTSVLHKIR